MDTEELDAAINELELRVERLRSLYEQYFLGIEKIEPGVARKDVDRRIWQLKREKIRNTARRFKLQTVIQRYNTYQQYWHRICREIENGTYRRHVLRAERATATVSDIVAKQARDKAASEQRGPATEAMHGASHQIADMLARDVDAEQEFARAVAAASEPATAQPSQGGRRRFDTLDLELEGFVAADRSLGEPGSASGAARPSPWTEPKPKNLLAALGPRQPVPQPTATGTGTGTAGAVPVARPARRAQQVAASPATGPTAPRASGLAGDVPRPGANAARPTPELSDQRIQELHRQLLAVKSQTKETGKVSVKGLAKSLRAAETKLKQQHKNRRIDFDVVIKNGKAVVKPIVR